MTNENLSFNLKRQQTNETLEQRAFLTKCSFKEKYMCMHSVDHVCQIFVVTICVKFLCQSFGNGQVSQIHY
jgi:hypothetical protein